MVMATQLDRPAEQAPALFRRPEQEHLGVLGLTGQLLDLAPEKVALARDLGEQGLQGGRVRTEHRLLMVVITIGGAVVYQDHVPEALGRGLTLGREGAVADAPADGARGDGQVVGSFINGQAAGRRGHGQSVPGG